MDLPSKEIRRHREETGKFASRAGGVRFRLRTKAELFLEISTDIMVPAAGRGPGAAGSFWVTDLWIRCPAGADATLEFHGLDTPSAAPLAAATVHMNQPVVYLADVIRTAFGMDSG